MGRSKKEKIVDELSEIQEKVDTCENVDVQEISKDVAAEAVESVAKEAKKEIRKERTKNFFAELKAFLIIVLIVGGIGAVTWYWYKNIYEPNKNKIVQENLVIDENTKFNLVSIVSDNDFFVFQDEYVIFYKNGIVKKVTDIYGDVLFEGEVAGSNYYLDNDGDLYVVNYESGDYSNKTIINKLIDGKFEEVDVLSKDNTFYTAVIYDEKLIGFTGYNTNTDNYFDEADNTDTYYVFGSGEVEIGEYHFAGDYPLLSLDESIISNSSKYMVITKTINSKMRYGLYDLINKEIVIDTTYENLIAINDDSFIAVKDGKAGIIDAKSKKIVPFEYDFIAPFEEHFVVCKNGKMAVMNNNYELITGFDFEYEDGRMNLDFNYRLCCANFNTVQSYKIGDKFVLTTHNRALDYRYNYYDDNIYIINSDGSYDKVLAEEFIVRDGLVYSYLDGVYTFYNNDMSIKYIIDMNAYDLFDDSIMDYGLVELVNGNTLILLNDYYFDYKDGSEIDNILDLNYEIGNVLLNYDSVNDEYVIKIDGEIVKRVGSPYIQFLDNGIFYFVTGNEYVTLQRSE